MPQSAAPGVPAVAAASTSEVRPGPEVGDAPATRRERDPRPVGGSAREEPNEPVAGARSSSDRASAGGEHHPSRGDRQPSERDPRQREAGPEGRSAPLTGADRGPAAPDTSSTPAHDPRGVPLHPTPTGPTAPSAGAPAVANDPPARPVVFDPPGIPVHRDVAPDLRVEVRADGHRVEVVVHTTSAEVSRYADLGPELRASLEQTGFDLASFDARGDQPETESRSPVEVVRTNAPPRKTSTWTVAARGGRYA